MTTLRIYRAGLADPPAVPKMRVYRAALTGSAPTGPKMRVYRASVAGVAPSSPKLRMYRLGLYGVGAVTITPIAPSTVEPLSTVSLTAVVTSAGSPSFTWRQVSGPPVTLFGAGDTRTFTAPGTMAGAVVVIGVQASVGSTFSTEQVVTVTVLPQVTWTRRGASDWVPARFRL